MTPRKKWWLAAGVLTAIIAGLAVWGLWIEPRRLVHRNIAIALPHWIESSAPLRVALLTDLHVGSPHNKLVRLERIVRELNARQPDVVLLLGDYVIQGVAGGEFVTPEATAAELGKLRSRYGTFAVLGNHDWWLDGKRVGNALQANGIVLLEDSAVALPVPNAAVWLAGVSDFWEGRHDVGRALMKVPANASVIVLTHNPDVFPDVPGRVAITVAGHTHGGQVELPLIGRPVVPSRFGQRFAYGHVVEQGKHLYVSAGTGTSILPIRFRVPPEIVILNLQRSR